MAIDWERLSDSLGALRRTDKAEAWSESGSQDLGRRALSAIVGKQEIEDAIEWYLSVRPGFELVRSVLSVLKSDDAIDLCFEIATKDADVRRQRSAVELLRAFATKRTLGWTKTFLDSKDPDVQNWGASLLDQLVFRGTVTPDEAEAYILEAEQHPNPTVRATAKNIRSGIANMT